ncbi:tetratricopeptide repeat protein [Streptomyces sp. ID05-26A]|nr:tetratricopeptide repeat protein [Streptomyces sp. ID05-26A]
MTDPSIRLDRSVLGPVDHSQIVIGDNNTVVSTAERAPVRVRSPQRRAGAERLLFGIATDHHATDRPLTWLRPDAGVLPVQPRPEDADLLDWCLGDSPLRVRLVCGRGGQGKTTSAMQLVRTLRGRKHLAGFLDLTFSQADGAESYSARVRWAEIEAALTSRPAQRSTTLLVVDYAENEPLSLRRLLTLMRNAPSVRVLLLSRSEGNWWPELLADPAWSPLIEAEPVRFGSLTTHLPGDRLGHVHADAVRRFAERMPGGPAPATADTVPDFATTLDLYADALLRVLDAAAVERGEQAVRSAGGDPISDLLAHESRHVRSVLADQQVEMSPHDRDLVLAAPFLVPAATLDDAVRLLRALDLEGEHDEASCRRVAKVLGRLYPGEATVWTAPRPDRLPDSHLLGLADRAASDRDWTDLVSRLCGTDDRDLAEHVFKVMLRCLSTPGGEHRFASGARRFEAALDTLVRTSPKGYLLPALLLRPGAFTDAIEAALTGDLLTTRDVAAIEVALAGLGFSTSRVPDVVHLAHRLVQDTAVQPGAAPEAVSMHAWMLGVYAVRLTRSGQRDRSVPPAERAADLYQGLAETDPETYEPSLATSLGNLATCMGEAGQEERAVVPARRSVEIRERLAASDPETHLPSLAIALNTLASCLGAMGQHDTAITLTRRSVEIREQLADVDPELHLPLLATALTNLVGRLAEAGELGQSLAPAAQAVEIFEELADGAPDAYLPDLATTLINSSISLNSADQPTLALVHAERAADICRQLADVNPDAYLPDLATALINLPSLLAKAGRHEQALADAQRAVDILERLAESSPDAYLRRLARSLNNLANRLGSLEQHDAALESAQRAVEILSRLAQVNPDVHLHDLATALVNLASMQHELGRREEALFSARHSLDIHRRLNGTNHPGIANSFEVLDLLLAELGEFDEPPS